jgi:hypothetical protein
MSDYEQTYLYLIGTRGNSRLRSPVKIGITNSVPIRFDQLRTASPHELELIFYFVIPRRDIAVALEQCFLETQDDFRLRGEWFDIEPPYALRTLILCIQGLLLALPIDRQVYDTACELSRLNAAKELLQKFKAE